MGCIIKFPIDGRNSYLCKTGETYSLTTDVSRAVKFKDEIVAGNIIKSNLSKTFPYKKYAMIEGVEEKKEECLEPLEEKKSSIKETAYIKINLDQFQKDFDNLSQQFRDIKNNKEWLNKKLSELDKKITDVEHYLEFYTFNASDGYKLAKGLKDILIERREIKNQMKIIEILESGTCAGMMSGITGAKVYQAIKGDYDYTPRVLKGMFEGKVESKSS